MAELKIRNFHGEHLLEVEGTIKLHYFNHVKDAWPNFLSLLSNQICSLDTHFAITNDCRLVHWAFLEKSTSNMVWCWGGGGWGDNSFLNKPKVKKSYKMKWKNNYDILFPVYWVPYNLVEHTMELLFPASWY